MSFVIVQSANGLTRVIDAEDVADILADEPRLAILEDGAHGALIE
jgi:hypothetical protein